MKFKVKQGCKLYKKEKGLYYTHFFLSMFDVKDRLYKMLAYAAKYSSFILTLFNFEMN